MPVLLFCNSCKQNRSAKEAVHRVSTSREAPSCTLAKPHFEGAVSVAGFAIPTEFWRGGSKKDPDETYCVGIPAAGRKLSGTELQQIFTHLGFDIAQMGIRPEDICTAVLYSGMDEGKKTIDSGNLFGCSLFYNDHGSLRTATLRREAGAFAPIGKLSTGIGHIRLADLYKIGKHIQRDHEQVTSFVLLSSNFTPEQLKAIRENAHGSLALRLWSIE